MTGDAPQSAADRNAGPDPEATGAWSPDAGPGPSLGSEAGSEPGSEPGSGLGSGLGKAPAGAMPARPRRPRRRPVAAPPTPAHSPSAPSDPAPATRPSAGASAATPPAVTQPAETAPAVPPRTVLPAAHATTPAGPAAEAADAHAAGAQDATEAFTAPPAVRLEAEREDRITRIETAAAAQTVAAAGQTVAAAGQSAPAAAAAGQNVAEPETPERPELAMRVDGVPDVMVLPEPNRNRPTVAIEPERAARPAPTQATDSALETARWRMEHSPFWLSEEERAAAIATHPGPDPATGRGRPPRQRPQAPRRPLPGLVGMIVLALAAAFFSWVSAEPFWLAVGHGDPGTATVTRCIGSGVTQRCTGSFTAADGGYTVNRVALLGVDASTTREGGTAPARMVAADSRQAYVGAGALVHLRWVLGFLLVLLCGYGIAGTTGARQLETARARRHAVLISLAGPTLLLVGFLVAAY